MTAEIKRLRKLDNHQYSIVLSEDGTSLFLREWQPKKESSVAILLMHGMGVHSKYYTHLGQYLAGLGYHVYGLDLRGHGLSGGNRGDLESIDQLIEDFVAVTDYIDDNHERLVVFGHSMGVMTSVLLIKYLPHHVNGVILLSGGRIPDALVPELGIVEKLRILFFGIFRPGKQTIQVSESELVDLGDIEIDELAISAFTPRFFQSMQLSSFEFPKEMDLPSFVAVGDRDELFEVSDVREFYDELPSHRKAFAVIEGGTHTIIDPDQLERCGMINWLTQRFPV